MNKIALAILAHPDDAEFLCAGTLLRLKNEQGYQIHIATMTAGDCGSAEHTPNEIANIRRREGAAACQVVGATYHCVEAFDLRVFLDADLMERVVHLINKVRPQIIFTHSPDDYHLDHEMTSKLVRGATFAAPIPNYLYNRHLNPPIESIPHLYYCDPLEGKDIFGQPIVPAFRIDISSVMGLKEKMLEQHFSQRAWLLKHHGVDNFVDSMKEWGKVQGEKAGVPFAEGFRQHLGHSYPQNNILKELLGTV